MTAGADVQLAAVVLAALDDLRDLAVVVVEDLAEQEDGALDRRQALQQDEERHRERVGGLGLRGGVRLGAGQERFGQPLADVLLAADARGPEVVDAEACHDRREVRLRRLDLLAAGLGAMDAEEGLLDDVLGLADAADHPVGDREHQRPELFVRRFGAHASETR